MTSAAGALPTDRAPAATWGTAPHVRRGRPGDAGFSTGTGPGNEPEEFTMPRFLIERNIDGAAGLTDGQLCEIATTSNAAVASLGVPYNWVTSYVAGDKIYCVHEADDAETIR